MRAVTGTIISREPATIKQAAKVITKFCKSMDFGARRDVAAYLSRTSAAVEDLYLFHRDLRNKCKSLEQQKQEASVEIKVKKEDTSSLAAEVNEEKVEEKEDSKRKKKKRSREVKLENGDTGGDIEHGSDKREKKKKKKKKKIKIEE